MVDMRLQSDAKPNIRDLAISRSWHVFPLLLLALATWYQLHVFPRIVSRSWYQLHTSPRLPLVTYFPAHFSLVAPVTHFPALSTGCKVSRSWHWLLILFFVLSSDWVAVVDLVIALVLVLPR